MISDVVSGALGYLMNEGAEVFYNIYSLPRMEAYFKKLGYNHFYYKEFEIDIDLPKTNGLGRGTYTVKDESGKEYKYQVV